MIFMELLFYQETELHSKGRQASTVVFKYTEHPGMFAALHGSVKS